MHWTFNAAIFGFAATLCAVPTNYVVHEERAIDSSRWTKRDRLPGHAMLPVRIGLAQSNLDKAADLLMDVSDPSSPNFAKHWTSEEVIDYFQPSEETLQTVQTWLVDSGISRESIAHSKNKAWYAFHATAEQIETLLHTEYHEYEDLRSGGIMPACERYHLPTHVVPHVDYVTPGIKLLAPPTEPKEHQKRSLTGRGTSSGSESAHWRSGPWPKHHHPRPGLTFNPNDELATCDEAISPACIAALYQIPRGQLADPSNHMGIFEAELQYYDQLDLNLFFSNFTVDTNFTNLIPNGTHPIIHDIDGGVSIAPNISSAGGESMLDLDMAYPIVYPQKITYWDVDDIHYQIWANDTYTWGFNTLLDAIDGSYCTYCAYGECGDAPGIDPTYPDPGPLGYNGSVQCGVYQPTNVFSLSYGGQEADVPIAYQKRQCNEYLKLGLQGVSFIFASGDAGVGNYPAPYGDDGPTGCLGPKGDIFNPTWPNSCPYVTNVGATKVYPGRTVFEPESAVFDPAILPSFPTNYSSGGGFSNVFPIPEYQKSAVATFFAEHNPPYPYYSGLVADAPNPKKPNVGQLAGKSGGIYNRIGRGIPDVASNGDNAVVYVGGSWNLEGGTSQATPIFAAIINRLNEERIAVGKRPMGFLNPTLYAHPEMFNDITNGTNPGCGTLGFSAVEGWDPVTGLGTPNYPRMLEVFLSLP